MTYFAVLVIRPDQPVSVLTTRPTQRMAEYVCRSMVNAYRGQYLVKSLPAGASYCSLCGSTGLGDGSDCRQPVNAGSDDWYCALGHQGLAVECKA